MMKWKKFSTAPMDGSTFTAWLSESHCERHWVRFNPERLAFEEYSSYYEMWTNFGDLYQATHWMQIEPPKEFQ